MILGCRALIAVTSWSLLRDHALAIAPDALPPRGKPPYEHLVLPAVLAVRPGTRVSGVELASAWSEQAPFGSGDTRRRYAVTVLGTLLDAEAFAGHWPDGEAGSETPHHAFLRLALQPPAPERFGWEVVDTAPLTPEGFEPGQGWGAW